LDGIFGQRFGATGARRGSEFQVNAFTSAPQLQVALASDRVGNFTAAWTSDAGQDSSNAVIGRRFQGLFPASLAVTGEDDGVLEVNESFALATSWRNATGAAQSFQGLGTEVTSNPPTLVLTLSPTASYGTVADGAVGTCSGPCFSGSLTGTRGVGHMDFSFLETIQPDVQGQEQRWFLHIGDSFTDVPRTNPFYRFVETLLHRGVTGGCGPSAYCPNAAVTREQMAPFVLAAKEGTLYAPPGCTAPMFADVPASSPFCRWIEELARRGVAGGCGGGNYCPSDAVTREQMAVFVLRTLDEALIPPACTTPVFNDVPASSPFCRWIEELARRGVVSGCGGGDYCPAAAVSREQMGVFISVTFGLALYGP
jgi:S-layer family protein